MGVMKEKRKVTSGRISVRLNRRNGGGDCETGNSSISGMVISDVKQGDWTGTDH